MSGRVLLGLTSTKQRIKCLAQGHKLSTTESLEQRMHICQASLFQSIRCSYAQNVDVDKNSEQNLDLTSLAGYDSASMNVAHMRSAYVPA